MSETSPSPSGASSLSFEERSAETLRFAERLMAKHPDWITFFKAVMGVDGIIARLFPEMRKEFEQTETHAHLQRMLNTLLEKKKIKEDEKEPIRMITVRLPAAVHEALRAEAQSRQTSINKLCISKLLQAIETGTLPEPDAAPSDQQIS